MRAAWRDLYQGSSFEVEPVLLAVGCPFLLHHAGLILRSDFEPGQSQDQGPYADTRFRRMPRHPTPAASDNRCPDVPASPNPVERVVQLVPQTDEGRNRHFLVPLRPQLHDHFGKPGSLCVAPGHFLKISSSAVRFRLSAFVIVVALHVPETTLVSNQSHDVIPEISLVNVVRCIGGVTLI